MHLGMCECVCVHDREVCVGGRYVCMKKGNRFNVVCVGECGCQGGYFWKVMQKFLYFMNFRSGIRYAGHS